MRKQIDLAGFNAFAGGSTSECLEQELGMVLAGPNLSPAYSFDTAKRSDKGSVRETTPVAPHRNDAITDSRATTSSNATI